MARMLIIAIVIIAVLYVALQAYHYLRSRPIDWTGLAFAVGFVALAIYLHFSTGIGGI